MTSITQIRSGIDINTIKAFAAGGGLRFVSLEVYNNNILEQSLTVRNNNDIGVFGNSTSGTFTTNDGKTIVVLNGYVSSIT
jgi:hypothetical protein